MNCDDIFTSTLHRLAVYSQPSQYHQHSISIFVTASSILLPPRVFFVPLVYSALRPFPSPHHCIITSNFSHSYGFTLSFRPRLLLGPRLPLHEGERSELFSSKVQPSDFRAFLFLTARVLHGFGVLADVLLPLTPPSSVMNQMRFHFDFFARHWALSVCRWSVIRS